MFTSNGTYTLANDLANVMSVDLTRADLVSWIVFSRGVAPTIATQTKMVSYRNRHPEDDFIPLAIEIFGCLH
jgi:hypothetical protein